MNVDQFVSMLASKGIQLNSLQLRQFEQYFEILVEWNDKMNLTAITEREEVYLKHFYDSISAAFFLDFKGPIRICDVGAGAGFPSIPLKICFPDLQITIVDSLQKRIRFLEHLSAELKLENTYFYHDRAETFAQNQKFRSQFDIVMARAVARMSVLSELCLPLVKQGGQFVAMKAANAQDELHVAEKAIQQLGGKTAAIHSFELPIEKSERSIIVIDKIKSTPKKYPRKPGTPNKMPLE
ncbi:16S rRNA (guanine(527)-N(7))-methyltransferase RsmG [Lederbergia galactosidilytica]|uniref:Ribosomal RNA small subunit methyltransferase G n=1 Tax=Lederbergia galactosidilytica TaxID=217031 RepID=A0A178A5N5_9BACI|nr:16S rRNA (guanine(527)-N(7))-methyltransferase RsmG [Lederbergia galactosidilytica]MBP1915219.1 16S rRNA (guanine527-N7)-methyltransferase [Lederbergia galactosidilytica]OAK75442.1 16S rRNA methyltransferase [Lederbergia galactosidilytica]